MDPFRGGSDGGEVYPRRVGIRRTRAVKIIRGPNLLSAQNGMHMSTAASRFRPSSMAREEDW